MKKVTRKQRALSLNKETMRHLDALELHQAAGGKPPASHTHCLMLTCMPLWTDWGC